MLTGWLTCGLALDVFLSFCFVQHAIISGFGSPSAERMESAPERIVLSLVFNGKVHLTNVFSHVTAERRSQPPLLLADW